MAHTAEQIESLVKQMTLEEKCSLLSGLDFWHTKKVERLGIPNIMVSDGPHGLRKQDTSGDHLGINDSIKAICFPAACATASSFDRDLLKKLGETLGDECQAQDVSTILGPAINIKRSPLCGRNFEYVSEDPYLAGELSASYINAVQSKNVGTSLKHFALNNQEYRRLTNSSNADERTIREIYLPAFETAVKKAQPATIMHSYNLVNGEYVGESKWLLDEILRKEWGFKGLVMSDWGAVSNRVRALEAGCDLEMPASRGVNDKRVFEAVKKNPELEKTLDKTCKRILKWVFDFEDNRQKGEFDFEKHHDIARQIEEESIVLLKNEDVLPLKNFGSLAVIGEFAEKPRFQGGGSSHINTKNISSAVESLKKAGINFTYAKGFFTENKGKSEAEIEKLVNEAVDAAKKCDTILVFAGLPDSFESEGYDRKHLNLPGEQNVLIEKLCALGKKIIVVLHNGSPVVLPWVKNVAAIVEAYLGGEAVGEAVVNVLTGKVNPSGKLAETFPLRLEDTPSFTSFANDKTNTNYGEGIFVGYRYYDKRNMDVLFPFGFGLSYTTFEYESVSVNKKAFKDGETIEVSVKIKNTGSVDGKEIVQLYVSDKTNAACRPPKELKGFEKVFVAAGKSAEVKFTLDSRSLSWYNTEMHDWYAASGKYEILIGSSSRDIKLAETVDFTTGKKMPLVINEDTTAGDILLDERTAKILRDFTESHSDQEEGESSMEAISQEMRDEMFDGLPLRNLLMMGSNATQEEYETLLAKLKKAVE